MKTTSVRLDERQLVKLEVLARISQLKPGAIIRLLIDNATLKSLQDPYDDITQFNNEKANSNSTTGD